MRTGNWLDRTRGWSTRICLCVVTCVGAGALTPAQTAHDEDEWYDPTDWFDGNDVEWDDSYEWWDEGQDDDGYGWHYEWDSRDDEWKREYGYYEDFYDYDHYDDFYDDFYDDDRQYGWQYDWDARTDRSDRRGGDYDRYDGYDDSDRRAAEADRTSRASTRSGEIAFTGRVDGFQRMPSRGGEQLLLRLRLQDGRSRIVDLGTGTSLSELDLDPGELVTVRGVAAVRASSIEVANRRFDIERERTAASTGTDRTLTFDGTLEGFKALKIGRDTHMLGRVTMRDGSKRVVDFGAQSRLGDVELGKGDRLSVRGQPRTVEGEQVLVAREFTVNGRSFRPGASSRDAATAGAPRVIRGQVEEFQRTRLEGVPESDVVLRLELSDGSVHIVDFGRTAMSELGLREGAQIRVSGQDRRVAGQSVLTATDATVGSREVALRTERETGQPVEAGSRRGGD